MSDQTADEPTQQVTVRTEGRGPSRGRVTRRSERGIGSVLVLAMLGIVVATAVAVTAGVAVVAVHRRAQAAADLAALAAAGSRQDGAAPCTRAQELAARNGARATRCTVEGEDVVVEVVCEARIPGLGTREIGARARAGPAP